MSKIGIADSCLILTNEQQMCINIISCMVLLKIIKLKSRRKLFLTNRIIYTYFRENCWGWRHSRSDCKRLSTMTYHFYFKNSEPVYETEYMQSLKQFAVQEVFPAYVLKVYIYMSMWYSEVW